MKTWNAESKRKIVAPEKIKTLAARLHEEGKTIATLNGSFDLMHAGHLHILFEASQLCDVLFLGLNSDTSIKQYKGEDRPIIPLEYRLEMMAALGFVDYVTWFDETYPIALLEKIRPNIHVNGAEYGADCIEAETVKKHGGKVHVVDKIPGLSTSQVIERIQHLCV